MHHPSSKVRSFSLVEVMIAITILAVLAAVTIPMFHELQMRSRRAEVPVIMNGLATVLRSACVYANVGNTSNGGSNCGDPTLDDLMIWSPDATPGRAARDPGVLISYGEVFRPDGLIRGSYAAADGVGPTVDMIVPIGPGSCPTPLSCDDADQGCVFACSDVDGNGVDPVTEVIIQRNVLRAATDP